MQGGRGPRSRDGWGQGPGGGVSSRSSEPACYYGLAARARSDAGHSLHANHLTLIRRMTLNYTRRFALGMNDPADPIMPFLPPTDCRFRPDIRALELGEWNRATSVRAGHGLVRAGGCGLLQQGRVCVWGRGVQTAFSAERRRTSLHCHNLVPGPPPSPTATARRRSCGWRRSSARRARSAKKPALSTIRAGSSRSVGPVAGGKGVAGA